MKNTTGDQVVVPLRIGGISSIGDQRINALKIDSVYARGNGLEMLDSAIRNNSDENATLFYIDKEKATASGLGDDTKTIVRGLDSGLIHTVTDTASSVKIDVPDQQGSMQFTRWFNGSKVANDDGSPMVVYHGTSEKFTVFDMNKGRSTMDIQGSFFSPWQEDAAGYGDNVGTFYLSIKNPADEKTAYAALKKFQGQNEAGRKAKEYLESQGYDGVINGVPGQPEEFIAFHPTQIKSATDNIGTFDRNNPDYRYSTGGENTLADIDQQLVSSGIIPQEELEQYNNLPGNQQTSFGSAQRQFGSQTAQTSDALHQSVKDYLYTHSDYTPDTNQAQIDRSLSWIQSLATENDATGYHAALKEVTSSNFDYRSADAQAKILSVMGMAAIRSETGDQNAMNDELQLADAYNKQGTDIGRMLQARKIFRLMTPVGRQSVLQSQVDSINQQYEREGKTTRVALSDWTLRAAAEATTEEDFARVQNAAASELAEQMPANWKEKLRAWRMVSMLANPRTHVRNIIGNALFIPAVSLKNKIGAIAETVSGQQERTKALTPVLSSEIRQFAREDAMAMKDTLTGEAKYNEETKVQQNRKMFRTEFMNAVSEFNSNALEAEDWFFLKGHYRRALGGWMTANGYTVEQVKNDASLLEKGRAYAVEEAQKATYRDYNKTASMLNDVSRKGGKTGFLVDAVLPFKKTPANILKRGVEYSPVGIVKSLTLDAYHLKQYNDYQNGKLSALPEKAISPTQFIDKLCSGVSGSVVLALGALLSNAGVVSCGLGDDEDELEKLKGNQKYAINPGKIGNMITEGVFNAKLFGEDVTFTMDWAAPMSMPFFVGAAVNEQLQNEGEFDI